MGRRREGVGRALQRALGTEFLLPEVEPREGGTSLLMNPRRQRAFEYVWNAPCSHLRRISRDLRIPAQSLRWHLLRLREGALLTSSRAKGKTVYYAPWAVRAEDVPLFACLANGKRDAIVRYLATEGRLTQSQIFQGLGTYQQAILPPLGDLTRLGLLRTWKVDGNRFYELGDAFARLRDAYAAVADARADRLLEVLRRDGVSPKVQGREGDRLLVQVSNGVERSVLRFRLVPNLAEGSDR